MNTYKSTTGNVIINHHTTSSLVEIIVKSTEDDGKGGVETTWEKLWLDYSEFKQLQQVISEIKL